MYSKFKVCERHYLILCKRLQPIETKPAILALRVKQLWDARADHLNLLEVVRNNWEWFKEHKGRSTKASGKWVRCSRTKTTRGPNNCKTATAKDRAKGVQTRWSYPTMKLNLKISIAHRSGDKMGLQQQKNQRKPDDDAQGVHNFQTINIDSCWSLRRQAMGANTITLIHLLDWLFQGCPEKPGRSEFCPKLGAQDIWSHFLFDDKYNEEKQRNAKGWHCVLYGRSCGSRKVRRAERRLQKVLLIKFLDHRPRLRT